MNIQEVLKERFTRYVAIPSQSDETKTVVPSSDGQWTLARLLAKDLEELGLVDIEISEYAVVTAHLPARLSPNHKPVPTIGWVCHMDTVDVGMSDVIHPQLVRYQGGDICQNQEKGIFIKLDEHPELSPYVGDEIFVSDGTSVLGADDKSAIANVMTALQYLKENPDIEHGCIYIGFVPDEEIGLLGAKHMDFSKFPVDYAYTIDCCALGEVVYQTFNAASAVLSITGVTAHPMSSKGNLVNPLMVAHDYIALLDRQEMPEHTEKTEGFIWPIGITSDSLHASVQFVIRDHNLEKFKQKKEILQKNMDAIQKVHPRAQLSLTISDTYGNIEDAITPSNRGCIERILEKMEKLHITRNVIAMRGGTDGSFISTKGIPTPNYFTGAHNFHSVAEFLPMSSFEKSCRLTIELMKCDD